ncbi:MAG: hypothetical protein IT580_16880 [Verrucomicrobiales bacterium]|nr:hypothetical protein [Verrucomicrobiales bacterium]
MAAASLAAGAALAPGWARAASDPTTTESAGTAAFRGRNVIVIRFGGGVRRRESIDSTHTYAPFVARDLAAEGTLFQDVQIAQFEGLNTSHGEGTLNLLTGRYDRYQDVERGFLKARFEPKVPTVAEYLRKAYDVPPHQTLIVNGEDRPDEEFYTFSNHAGYGIDFRSNVLSLYRYKRWLFARQIRENKLTETRVRDLQKQLEKWEKSDPRLRGRDTQGAEMERFWERWREHYGESGLVNPRGDRLLTTLTLRALKELRPRLLMVNYNDCDYVHWGYLSHYTTGISIMDEGIREIWNAVQADPAYRDNTVMVVVPDCGRDSNPLAPVPCQHHFNSRSAHEIFALMVGAGVPRGVLVDKTVQQVDVASTVGHYLGVRVEHGEGRVLEEAVV